MRMRSHEGTGEEEEAEQQDMSLTRNERARFCLHVSIIDDERV